MLCPNCESPNRDEAKFCDECGFPLGGAIARASASLWGNDPDDPPQRMEAPEGGAEEASPDQGEGIGEGLVGESGETSGEAENDPEPGAHDSASAGATDDPSAEELAEKPDAAADGDAPTQVIQDEGQVDGSDSHSAPETDASDSQAVSYPEPASDGQPGSDVTGYIAVDLGGFDRHSDEYADRIAPAGYQADGGSAFRDGGTMQMSQVEDAPASRSRDYLASSTAKRAGHGKTFAIVALAVAIAVALAVAVAYQMQLWGGKVVPDVTGMTEADARSVLVDEGFAVRSQEVKSDDTEGLVLIVDPTAGSRTDEGSEVVIHISTARTVPDVAGKTKDEATKALNEAGYENVTYENANSEKKKGTVLSSTPAAGSRTKSSDVITLKVAAPYTVPDISGMSLDGAISAIEKAGLGYEVVYLETDSYAEGAVIGTEPAAGTEVEKGSYVVVQVAQARGSELESLASAYLAPGETVSLASGNYLVESLDSVSYVGDDTVAFTITGRPYTYLFGETLFATGSQTVSGTIVYTSDNQIAAIS